MNVLKIIAAIFLLIPNVVHAETRNVDDILAEMTISEKVGQMMFIGIYGTEIDEDSQYMLETVKPGGIILFDRNLSYPEQVQNLTRDVQNVGNPAVYRFISIDEEGGFVARMRNYIEVPPSQESLGNTGDSNLAREWSMKTADNLKNLGINLNFAPVLDVGRGDGRGRSYSYDSNTVAIFADSAADGYDSKKFFYTLKHFPGIGKSVVDQHVRLSTIDATFEELQSDLLPFKTIFEKHSHQNFMVMIGHNQYSAINPDEPATLSKNVMQNLLRDQLGFDGVIITDDMDMGSISVDLPRSELGVRVIQAGGDVILVCHEYSNQLQVFNGILDAVADGRISEARLDDSVRRILLMKMKGTIE